MENSDVVPSMAPVCLPISFGTELQIELLDINLRIKSELIGLESKRYIIMKISDNDLSGIFRNAAVKKNSLVVRYLYNGSVYGFKTSALAFISAPARLLFAGYPESIEEFNVRIEERYNCILPAKASLGGGSVDLVIVDICRGGCRAVIKTSAADNKESLDRSINMDMTLDLAVFLPGVAGEFGIKGAIRSINKDSSKISFGLKFEAMEPKAREGLDRYISLISAI